MNLHRQHLENFQHLWNIPKVYTKKPKNESITGIKPSLWATVIKAGLDLISLAKITPPPQIP